MRKKIDSFLLLSMLELKMNLFSFSLACTFIIKCIKQSLKPLKEIVIITAVGGNVK